MAHWTGRERSDAEWLRGSVWRDVVAPTICILLAVAVVVLIGIVTANN